MGFPFELVCKLLEDCYENRSILEKKDKALEDWFKEHQDRIKSPDCNLAAFLSTLLPEKRTDRVYCIQVARLEKLIARALGLGTRVDKLAAYRQPGLGHDLGDRVELILKSTPNLVQPLELRVTVEEIDDVLNGIASKVRWSSPSIRAANSADGSRNIDDLEGIYRRASPLEAKWLTRLVLKDFQPLTFESYKIYRACDERLPFMMKIHDDFAVAIESMQQAKLATSCTNLQVPYLFRRDLATIKPRLSVKVGRQDWFKARSIKHCLQLCQGRISVQTKVDGEYCQIHVDISKGRRGIQIFSKSGKDSTEDRQALLVFIVASLKMGTPECKIQNECILEGELVVYSDHERKLLPFHHIRNHVTRRGRLLHTEQDSPPRPYEHLMIVYYDMLLIDGESLLSARQSQRFKRLEEVIHTSKGEAELVSTQMIDTGHPYAASELRKAFANVIVGKGEGLVLKPDLPYLKLNANDSPFTGRCIKFKKEYIGKFGDVGDFAVVGAGFLPPKAKSYPVKNLQWTHFFIGCLDNGDEVKRWKTKPQFTVVSEVELNATLLKTFVSHGNTMAVPQSGNQETILNIQPGVQIATSLTTAFTRPPVFDLRCFGFEKAGNTGFWSLRFPTVTKVHFDRDYTDTISFEELQRMAEEASSAPEMEDSQENLKWIAKLESADPRGQAIDAMTQETMTTEPSPSPEQASQPHVECIPSVDSQNLLQDSESCKFRGSDCQLTNKIIFVDPHIQIDAEVLAALLKDHGLTHSIRDPRTRPRENWLLSMSSEDPQPGSNVLLLVDSVKDPTGTRALVLSIKLIRKDLPAEIKNSIRVYDWRVLNHVSIQEDDEVTKKYYDGFPTPWNRWYVGAV